MLAGVGAARAGDGEGRGRQHPADHARPGARHIVANGLEDMSNSQHAAGLVAIIGIVIAFWSATSYVGGFMRAANRIYDVPEGRPLWKTVPIQLAFTAITGVLLRGQRPVGHLSSPAAWPSRPAGPFGFEQQTVRGWVTS